EVAQGVGDVCTATGVHKAQSQRVEIRMYLVVGAKLGREAARWQVSDRHFVGRKPDRLRYLDRPAPRVTHARWKGQSPEEPEALREQERPTGAIEHEHRTVGGRDSADQVQIQQPPSVT